METEPNAVTDNNIMEEDCVEILVKTDYSEVPRGKEDVFDRAMTSFETLVYTALALEGDPRNEHSYAYSDKKNALDGMDKDHCYAFCSKLAHRKVASLSDENLASDPANTLDKNIAIPFMLPHYRSNDSALDVTGFDSISDKCHSFENIHVKTVDVFSENCILPGVSDPDLSRMTIQGKAETETSSSLPNRLQSNMDHSYSQKLKDSLPKSAGVKRGRSNDDINLLADNYVLKRKDFTKSPFLDHSYQAIEWQKLNPSPSQDRRACTYEPNASSHATNSVQTISNAADCESNIKTNKDDVMLMTSIAFPNQPLSDHTYEEMSDSTAELPLTDLIIQTRRHSTEGRTSMFTERKTDTDHSYVLLQQTDDCDDKCSDSDSLSDSGTESLNEEQDSSLSTNNHCVTTYKDHAYVK